jgi:hypothetical protein
MTSILERTKNALTPRLAHQAEVGIKYDALIAARKVAADLGQKFTEANRGLETAESEMRALALAAMDDPTADNKFEKAKGTVKAKKDYLEKIQAAQGGADVEVKKAECDLRKVSHQDRVRELNRWNNAAAKVAAEIEELVATLHEKHTKLCELGRKRQWSWPDRNAPQHAMLYEVEVTAALAHEFARVSLKPFVDRITPPQLPGSEVPWEFGQDRSQIKSLSAAVLKANEWLLRAINELPLPGVDDAAAPLQPEKPAPQSAPQPKPAPASSNGETYDARNYAPPKTSVRI